MARKGWVCATLLTVLAMGLVHFTDVGKAATTVTQAVATIYNPVFDEQNTTAFYNNGTAFCSGLNNPVQSSALLGDPFVVGPMTAYQFVGPWTSTSQLSSSSY